MGSIIGILDTDTNKNRVEYDGDLGNDKAIVKKLNEALREYTFKQMINHLISDADEDERPVADEANQYMEQHDGNTTICEVKVCDAEGNYMPGRKNPQVIDLEEKVGSYMNCREIEGEEFDCIEMILGQITAVGGR